ncbi:Gfo/Idh/MocA family protein [Acidimangrovimonas sediminis]|uniref:Gfo/Idh/MocA family protein n=1 Tax=Acidimangrovimonas sediminis TaxID=2056283 RepID=UPI000C80566D|nr:Gfo/Idh/MocA family oxidoreductase [Acidimangrovimonas sediminis]
MTGHLNWGILSAAKIAREFVAPALEAAEGCRIAAVASRTPGKAEALAAPYGDLRIHHDYEALLADPGVDAVYIGLPNSAHVEWTEKALRAGKHVLCEKPLAMKHEEIARLIRARDESGRFAAEGYMVTHHPQWTRVKALIAAGEIGTLRHVQSGFSFVNTDRGNIRNDRSQGGGALRDIGVYPSIVTRFVTGEEPGEVSARLDWEDGIDASARVWAEFPSFTMDFFVSMRRAKYQQMLFHGDRGWIRATAPFNADVYGPVMLEISTEAGIRTEDFNGHAQYRLQAEAFARSALEGAAYPCPLEMSFGNQRMIDAIYMADESWREEMA